MNNSPYLDRPLVPLAVALRSTLAEIETKIATAAPSPRRARSRRLARQMVRQILKADRLGRRQHRRDAELLPAAAAAP
jgi:uncharacterized protein with von Willebrand factor type A (vWA) domain